MSAREPRSQACGPRDPYKRRREAGRVSREDTQRRLLQSADRLFRTNGYAQSPVTAIAQGAGVSLQTLYLAWGSKRALLRAATDAAASEGALPLDADQWHTTVLENIVASSGASDRASDYLAGFARVFVRVAVRTAIYWRINRDAAGVDEEVAAAWDELLRDRRATMNAVAANIPRSGLRADVSTQMIADTLWTLTSPDNYALLTTLGGYTDHDVEQWSVRILVAALTDDRAPRAL